MSPNETKQSNLIIALISNWTVFGRGFELVFDFHLFILFFIGESSLYCTVLNLLAFSTAQNVKEILTF